MTSDQFISHERYVERVIENMFDVGVPDPWIRKRCIDVYNSLTSLEKDAVVTKWLMHFSTHKWSNSSDAVVEILNITDIHVKDIKNGLL